MQYWCLSGSLENWEVAISSKVWGVKEGRRSKSQWDKVSIGDILVFYVAKSVKGKSVKGIIGIGRVVDKFIGEEPLFPDERNEGRVIWRYRLHFEIVYVLPRDRWKGEKIPAAKLRELGIPYYAGLNKVKSDKMEKLLNEMSSRWKDFPVEEVQQPISAPIKIGYERRKKKESERKHDEIVRKIKEIGDMKGFKSEKEYEVDDQRLDVVWRPRDVPEGAPKYVFEVEFSGNFYRALAKLKHAFDKWAYPKLFIVIKKEDRSEIEELLSGTFHELKGKVKMITPEEIDELYNLERKAHEVEEKLGII